MASDRPLQRGDFVRVTGGGKTIDAMVTLASENGRSIILMFDAMMGGWVGTMPALLDNDAWRALDGLPLEIERR